MKKLFFIIVFMLPLWLFSQEEKKFGISFSGYVKNDIFFDSRQTVNFREGEFLLYPRNELLDVNGKDANATAGFNMLSIQSGITGNITGPDAFGAKTSALIEGEYSGTSDAGINTFSLRQAYVKLNWKTTELLIGQTWHPMFNTDCMPGVISFNNGAPFQPYSRNPQIRLNQSLGDITFLAALLSQRDFTSPGGSASLRNSGLPDIQLQLQYKLTDKETGTEFLAGIGGGYKELLPRLETDSFYMTREKVKGISYLAYLKYKSPFLTFKCMGVTGQNLYDLTMLGGYAFKTPDPNDTIRINHNDLEYTTINCFSVWADMNTNGEKIQGGLFLGYTENLGAVDYFTGGDFIRGIDIKYLYRISPRIIVNSGRMRFAGELEYTVAAYGHSDPQGKVLNTKEVGNLRALLAVYYFF
ncbi:MAG: hypothetical protein NTW49_10820 [Bacteroidia bacterium]|nr:hypothetical protein [Bacteroidia bacterium]